MPYSIVKPDTGPSPNVDAAQIQDNFSSYAAVFSQTAGGAIYEHTPLNDPNQGDHETILFKIQSNDPGVNNNFDVLFSKNVTDHSGTQPQLFVQVPKFLPNAYNTRNTPNDSMQLTYNAVNVAGPIYQSFLVGGYLIYFGTVTSIAADITLVPAPTQILCALAASNNMDPGTTAPYRAATSIVSTSSFHIYGNPAGVYSYRWLAIAKA